MGEMFENMNNLRRLSGDAPPEFLLTHPLSSSRVNDAFNAAEGISNEGTKSDSLEYSLIKSRLKIHYEKIPSNSLRFFIAQSKENKTEANIYGLALAYSVSNSYDESLKLLDDLISRHPKNLFLNTTKVEILTKAQRYEDALKLI